MECGRDPLGCLTPAHPFGTPHTWGFSSLAVCWGLPLSWQTIPTSEPQPQTLILSAWGQSPGMCF